MTISTILILTGSMRENPRDRIIRLRNEAEYIRLVLDMPPRCSLPPEAVLSERIEAANWEP
jgi:hypothetical protein